ncbi:MAG: nucleoside-diphosphate sugar epimerase/dehydratase [bacterium]|nr:nucleoside-diphosphate sugar epimerase/dehydratase [bacterium]
MLATGLQNQKIIFALTIRRPNFWIILVVDIFLLFCAHYFAYVIRFDFQSPTHYAHTFCPFVPLVLALKIPVFYLADLYRGMWRYTSFDDVVHILYASIVSTALIVAVIFFYSRFEGLPRSVFLLDFILTFLFISSFRAGIRLAYQKFGFVHGEHAISQDFKKEKKRIILVGAGDEAEKIIRETEANQSLPYKVVGLLDDDPALVGYKLHGKSVVGLVRDVAVHARRIHAQEILITTAGKDTQQIRRVVKLCQASGLPYKILPGFGELVHGRLSVRNIRDVDYKDLLGRDVVQLEHAQIGAYLTGKCILVTGAGGSIGSELCRQIVRYAPGKLVLLDAGEENLYKAQMELRHEHEGIHAEAVLGKVQDRRLLEYVFASYQPQVVFHAAAYKHVPLVERNPWQAVYNNIFGSQLVMEAAILYGVERFVLVSTDKAVRPANVMGASKRVTELLMQAYCSANWDGTLTKGWNIQIQAPNSHNTRFMGVRFGNVLGSSGSVIPLFKRQIERGGPVTVTHPEVTRYFMSVDEAAQLILQAGSMGEGGEIFILKMGQPIKIAEMARELILLCGKDPDSEIAISYIGLREGEKLYEELITEGEGIVDTGHDKIMVLKSDTRLPGPLLDNQLERLAHLAAHHDSRGVKSVLHEMVPEYKADYSIC